MADDLDRRLREALQGAPTTEGARSTEAARWEPSAATRRAVLAGISRRRATRRRVGTALVAAALVLAVGVGIGVRGSPPARQVAAEAHPSKASSGHPLLPSTEQPAPGSVAFATDLPCAEVAVGSGPASCGGTYSSALLGAPAAGSTGAAPGASSSAAAGRSALGGAGQTYAEAAPPAAPAPLELTAGQAAKAVLPAVAGSTWGGPTASDTTPAGTGRGPVVRLGSHRSGGRASGGRASGGRASGGRASGGGATVTIAAAHPGAAVVEVDAGRVTWSLQVVVEP